MNIEVNGMVVVGQRMDAVWMGKDSRLFADALKTSVHPGTINVRCEATETAAHPRLKKQLLFGGECVNAGYIRGMRKLVVRDCTINGVVGFIVRHQIHPDGSCLILVIGPTVPDLKPESPIKLSLDIDAAPRAIAVSAR
jgi:hypothetical protein